MRDEEQLERIRDRLWELFEKYRESKEDGWRAQHMKDQYDVLEFVLEDSEAEDVFDAEVLEGEA